MWCVWTIKSYTNDTFAFSLFNIHFGVELSVLLLHCFSEARQSRGYQALEVSSEGVCAHTHQFANELRDNAKETVTKVIAFLTM